MEVLAAKARNGLDEIFKVFIQGTECDPAFFDVAPGSKMSGHVRIFDFVATRFASEFNDTLVLVYNKITSKYEGQESYKMVFLAQMVKLVTRVSTTKSTKIDIISMLDILYCLAGKLDESCYGRILPFCIQAVNDAVAYAGVGEIIQWFNERQLDKISASFMRYLKWPTGLSNEDLERIGGLISYITNLEISEETLDNELTEALVAQILSFSGCDEDVLAKIAEGIPETSNRGKVAHVAFDAVIPSHFEAVKAKFSELMERMTNGIEFSVSVAIATRMFENSREQADIVDLLKPFLVAMSEKLGTMRSKDSAGLKSVLQIVYNMNKDHTMDVLRDFCVEAKLSSNIINAMVEFARLVDVDLALFVPKDSQKVIQFARILTRLGFEAYHESVIIDILNMVSVAFDVAKDNIQEGPTNMDHEIANFVMDGDLEDVLPYNKVERLCFLCFYHSDVNVRLAAYDLLTLCGEVFEKENDDWKNYELSAQPFIRSLNIDFNVYVKKNVGVKCRPRELLERDVERLGGLTYICKKLPSNRAEFAGKIFRETYALGVHTPILFDVTICVMTPALIKKLGKKAIKVDDVYDRLEECNHLSSLKYLQFTYIETFLGKMIKSTKNEAAIMEAFNGLTECIESSLDSVTPELITLELEFLQSTFTKTQSREMYHIAAKSCGRIAMQIYECKELTQMPRFIGDCRGFMASARGTDTNKQYPEIYEALLNIELVMLSFNSSYQGSLEAILGDSNADDSIAVTNFLRKLMKRNSEKAVSIMKTIFKWVPTAVATVLIENPVDSLEELTLFCYFMSDDSSRVAPEKALAFVKSKWPDFTGEEVTMEMFVSQMPQIESALLDYAESFFDKKSHAVSKQIKLIDVIMGWASLDNEHFDRVINLAAEISHAFLMASSIFSEFWGSMMKNEDITLKVFRSFVDNGAEAFVTAYVYKHCPHKKAVMQMIYEIISKEIDKMLTEGRVKCIRTLLDIVTLDTITEPATVLMLAICLQIEGSMLCFEAVRFIKKHTGGCSDGSVLESLVQVVEVLEKGQLKELLSSIHFLATSSTSVESIKKFTRILLVILTIDSSLVAELPQHTKLGKLGSFIAPNGDTEVFRECASFLFRTASCLCGQNIDFWKIIIEFGVICAEFGISTIDEAFMSFITSVASVDFTPFLSSMSNDEVSSLVKLLIHSDWYSNLITVEILPKQGNDERGSIEYKFLGQPVSSLLDRLSSEDKVAGYWLKTMSNGNEQISHDDEILESFRTQLAFCGAVGAHKMVSIIYKMKMRTIADRSNMQRITANLLTFMLLSADGDPKISHFLYNQLSSYTKLNPKKIPYTEYKQIKQSLESDK